MDLTFFPPMGLCWFLDCIDMISHLLFPCSSDFCRLTNKIFQWWQQSRQLLLLDNSKRVERWSNFVNVVNKNLGSSKISKKIYEDPGRKILATWKIDSSIGHSVYGQTFLWEGRKEGGGRGSKIRRPKRGFHVFFRKLHFGFREGWIPYFG